MYNTMKQNGRSALVWIWAAVLFCVGPLSAAAASGAQTAEAENVTVKLDGKPVNLDQSARLIGGSIFVPLKSMAVMFGASMEWNNANEEATIHTDLGDTIILGNGVPVVYFNGGRYVLDAAPNVYDGRMYVPLRDTAEMLHGKVVGWNAAAGVAELATVQPAVVTEELVLASVSEETGIPEAKLMSFNGLPAGAAVKPGTKLRTVIPSVLSREAAPFTDADLNLLAKITQVEAGYESYEGQLAIANVILNRVKDSRFPSTIKDVIYSGKQFPPAHNGLLDKAKPNASVLRAAKDALNGKNNVAGAVYFYNPKVSKGGFWSSLDVVATIGNHRFAK